VEYFRFASFYDTIKKTQGIYIKMERTQSQNEEVILTGYIHDIKQAFHIEYGREATRKDSEIIASTLYSIINSYYFEGLYQYSKIGTDHEDNYYLKVIPSKNLEKSMVNIDGEDVLIADYTKKIMGESRRRMPKNNELPISGFSSVVDLGIGQPNENSIDEIFITSNLEILPVIKRLKELKPELYNIIFEENDLKQSLIVKSKHDLTFDVVSFDNLDNYLKDTMNIQQTDDVYSTLNKNYDLRYLVKEAKPRNTNGFAVVAHNKLEIGGIAIIDTSIVVDKALSHLGEVAKDISAKFLKVSSVMVSNNYRGQGLGVLLFDHIINEAAKKDFVIIRSEASELGRNFLKKNIDTLASRKQVPVINAEWMNAITPLLPKMFNGQWEAGKTMLIDVITDVKAFDKQIHEKKMNARSSNDFFDIEDEEKDFMSNLTKRFDKKPASKVKVR
jgi:GNAT superfamily N-acetyltransferase